MTISFYIIHLNIWSLGNVLKVHEDGRHTLNCMCDLTQFVVSCIRIDTRSEPMSNFFMEQVILIFVMVAAVVVDTDSRFRSTFEVIS